VPRGCPKRGFARAKTPRTPVRKFNFFAAFAPLREIFRLGCGFAALSRRGCAPLAVAAAFNGPSMVLPFTRPVYGALPAVKLISSPLSLPEIGVMTLPFLRVPEIIGKSV